MSNRFTHIYTHTHKKALGCNQTHTYTHTHTSFCKGKLVLINLAGGARHVFPFTSWPVPWVAQWKPSILVCLQFVCLNFLLICIIHWCPVGPLQEVLSEDGCGIFFYPDIIHHAFFFLLHTHIKKTLHSFLPLPSRGLLRMRSFWYFEAVALFLHGFSAEQSGKEERIISMMHENSEEARKASVTVWLWGTNAFLSYSYFLSCMHSIADHPLDNFQFPSVSEEP